MSLTEQAPAVRDVKLTQYFNYKLSQSHMLFASVVILEVLLATAA